ncbi:MAG: prolyl aminopeptidase [Actinomycetota bacterium]
MYPVVEPYVSGMLSVGGPHELYWEACGNPDGKPALVLHGGPGSGCSEWHRRLFDPRAYNVILFDQRNCGRSQPHASDPAADLSSNTTDALIADVERIRRHFGIPAWLLLGGSWGSCLALAYAQSFPQRVTELVLFGVTTGKREEFDQLFREGLRSTHPAAWARRQAFVARSGIEGDAVDVFSRLLASHDRRVREETAYEWCLWESATSQWPPLSDLAPRFRDPTYAVCFARLVTHYVRHDGWVGDGRIMAGIEKLQAIPAVLISGERDAQSPPEIAAEVHHRWPRSSLVVVDNAGHSANNRGIEREIVRATDRFAGTASAAG